MDSVDGQWARRYGWMWLLLACGGRAGLSEGEVTRRSNGGVPNAVPSTIAGRLPNSGTGSGAAATGGAIGASSASGVRIVALGGVGASERHGRQPCGNLKIEPGEECDDGNVTAGDGCSPTCKLEPMGCPTNRCVLAEVCGDGRLGTRESCDDGNMTAGDGCGSECNAIEPGWICPWPGQACFTLCGDAIVAGAETCDQGNRNGVFVGSTTGCSHECRTVPGCVLDGAPSPCPDACMDTATGVKPAFCPGTCGDGVIDWNEQCDFGSDNQYGSQGACTTECKYGSLCGDGTRDPPEECDLGPKNGAFPYGEGGCTSLCELTPYCGNGIVESAFDEECDLGASNDLNNNCTSICKLFLGP